MVAQRVSPQVKFAIGLKTPVVVIGAVLSTVVVKLVKATGTVHGFDAKLGSVQRKAVKVFPKLELLALKAKAPPAIPNTTIAVNMIFAFFITRLLL